MFVHWQNIAAADYLMATFFFNVLGFFPFPSVKMQLFLRAQNTHTLEVTGQETIGQIKVKRKIQAPILKMALFSTGLLSLKFFLWAVF